MKKLKQNAVVNGQKLKSKFHGAEKEAPGGVQPSGKVKKVAAAKLAMKAGLKKKKKQLLANVSEQQQQQQQLAAAAGAAALKRKSQLLGNAGQPAAGKRPKLTEPGVKKVKKAVEQSTLDQESKSVVKKAKEKKSVGKAADKQAVGEQQKTGKAFLQDTEPVKDPIVRAEIQACIEERMRSTVRVRPLPNRLRLAQMASLCDDVTAVRVPWDYVRGRNKGVAFLEFADAQTASRRAQELDGNKSLGCRLGASVREDLQLVDADDYNCARVVVSSLHPQTSAQELKELVRACSRVDFLTGSKSLRKHTPAVAFLTFDNERDALKAVRQHQGEVIRNRKTSWMFQKRVERLEDKVDRTELVVFGVSKKVTDEQLVQAFPSCQKLDVRHSSGMAVVVYGGEEDCRRDFDACKGGVLRVGKARLRVFYGHRNYKPVDARRREAAAKAEAAAANEATEAAGDSAPAKRKMKKEKGERGDRGQKKIDASLFNKSQLIVKDFHPSATDASFAEFVDGVQRVFFTGNRRLAFLHFSTEAAAAAAKEKLASETFNGAKLKVMYAMDKPDKKQTAKAGTVDKKALKRMKKAGGGRTSPDKPKRPPAKKAKAAV